MVEEEEEQDEEKGTTMATATYYLHSMFFMLSVYSVCVRVCASACNLSDL